MYLIVAFAVTIMVIALAWHGVGLAKRQDDDRTGGWDRREPPRPPRPSRPLRYESKRTIAPDDDPEFLSEIDRRLRGGDGKST